MKIHVACLCQNKHGSMRKYTNKQKKRNKITQPHFLPNQQLCQNQSMHLFNCLCWSQYFRLVLYGLAQTDVRHILMLALCDAVICMKEISSFHILVRHYKLPNRMPQKLEKRNHWLRARSQTVVQVALMSWKWFTKDGRLFIFIFKD